MGGATDPARPLWRVPGAAMRAVLREGYSWSALRADLLAGLVVGIVALPLSMALAIAVNVPPQHGLYTAIVAGVVVGLLGGSRVQISGPTAAFIVILAPIQSQYGLGGLLFAGVLAGLILIGFAVARFGQLISYIPHPVTTGFTAGIGVVIATFQLKDLLGLQLARSPDRFHERVHAMAEALGTWNPAALAVGLGTLVVLIHASRFTTKIPSPLIALSLAAVAVYALERLVPGGLGVETIGSRFSYELNGQTHAGIPRLPPLPVLPWTLPGPGGASLDVSSFGALLARVQELLPAALAIALLGAIETLLSAVVADGLAGTRHDPDAELLAAGVGNVVVPFFGGIAATGAIARTATNIGYGARSPLASVAHALVVLLAVLALAPLLAHLPMPALAGMLLLVAWNMSDAKHFAHMLRVAPRSDLLVLLTCFALTVLFDMAIAVSVGVVLASLLFLGRMAEISTVTLIRPGESAQMALPEGVVLYRIAGPVFFGAAQKAMSALGAIGSSTRAVIIDLAAVPAIDATGLVALESALKSLRDHHVLAVLVGLQPQPAEVLSGAGLVEDPARRLALRPTIDDAIGLLRAPPAAPASPASP